MFLKVYIPSCLRTVWNNKYSSQNRCKNLFLKKEEIHLYFVYLAIRKEAFRVDLVLSAFLNECQKQLLGKKLVKAKFWKLIGWNFIFSLERWYQAAR